MPVLEANEILDAINELLVDKWPDRTVYCDDVPQDFTRKSFAILEDIIKVEDGGLDCVEITASYTILGYLPKDRRGHVDRLGLNRLLRQMQDLFRGGRLFVSDRALPITGCSGSIEQGAAFVDLTLTFYDDRAPAEPKKTMQHIQMKTQVE